MANSFSQLFYHVVFSTKGRVNFIHQEIEARVWEYIGGIARTHNLTALRIGGIENHIHGLVMARPLVAPCDIPMWLKGESSKWIHREMPRLGKFGWQDGYGIFSVSKSNVPAVIEYIKNHREHHKNQSFEEEYLALLKLHEVDYDQRLKNRETRQPARPNSNTHQPSVSMAGRRIWQLLPRDPRSRITRAGIR